MVWATLGGTTSHPQRWQGLFRPFLTTKYIVNAAKVGEDWSKIWVFLNMEGGKDMWSYKQEIYIDINV